MPGAAFSVEFDAKAIARITRKLEKAQGRPLMEKMRRATLAAADLLVQPIRSAGPRNRTGLLRRSVRARAARKSFGVRSIGALVGPTAPHRHLIIQGHRIVTPGGRYTGRRTVANPYVDRAAAGHQRKAAELVRRIWFEDVR
jgi:hypothetical protein